MSAEALAVVLAGGEGRRMGGLKPLRRFGGATLIANALNLAGGYGGRVAVVVRAPTQIGESTDAALLLDDPAIQGPLGGLAAALSHARRTGADLVLTLPCDMPHLPADLRARLEAALGPEHEVAVAASGGRLHPVCALWRAAAVERLPAYVASGRRSLKDFAATCGMATVEWDVSADDPFANANTPEELAALQPPSG